MNFIQVKKYWIFTLFLCLTLFIQAQNDIGLDYIYDFPVNPDTKEWGNLKTESERFDAMQIPFELLKSMSTESLIITCLNYPAFAHYTAFNNIQDGINHTIKNFNGLQELYLRQDAPSKMLSVYSKLSTSNSNVKSIKTNFWWMRFCYFELLLTKKDVIDKLTENEKMNLIKEAYKKITDKIGDKEQNSLFNIQSSLLIIAKILDDSNYIDFQQKKKEDKEIEVFLNTGSITDLSLISNLLELANNYINSK
jgi:hypothetical protein